MKNVINNLGLIAKDITFRDWENKIILNRHLKRQTSKHREFGINWNRKGSMNESAIPAKPRRDTLRVYVTVTDGLVFYPNCSLKIFSHFYLRYSWIIINTGKNGINEFNLMVVNVQRNSMLLTNKKLLLIVKIF